MQEFAAGKFHSITSWAYAMRNVYHASHGRSGSSKACRIAAIQSLLGAIGHSANTANWSLATREVGASDFAVTHTQASCDNVNLLNGVGTRAFHEAARIYYAAWRRGGDPFNVEALVGGAFVRLGRGHPHVRADAATDNPVYLRQRERVCDSMRKAGVPEG
jgi:hypothetical protein